MMGMILDEAVKKSIGAETGKSCYSDHIRSTYEELKCKAGDITALDKQVMGVLCPRWKDQGGNLQYNDFVAATILKARLSYWIFNKYTS